MRQKHKASFTRLVMLCTVFCSSTDGSRSQLPEPESPTFTGKIVSPVGYIAVAPDDHAELVRKADLYNDLKAVIDRLDCEIQDIKRLFV